MTKLQTNLTQVKPWVALDSLALHDCDLPDGSACELIDAHGHSFGAGILDRRDPQAAWRRFSWDPKAQFDLDYLVETMEAAVERRPEVHAVAAQQQRRQDVRVARAGRAEQRARGRVVPSCGSSKFSK